MLLAHIAFAMVGTSFGSPGVLSRDAPMPEWYLLRTKVGEGRKAQGQLLGIVESTLLPMGRSRIPQRGRMVERITPLFPCYV